MSAVIIPIVIIAVLIAVNGFFVAAEFAIAAASRPRVAQQADSGSTAALHTLYVLSNSQEINLYLGTAQVGITVASLGLGMYGEHAIAGWLLGPLEHWGGLGEAAAHTIALVTSVGLLTYLHVVLGEMVPKSLALQSASEAAVRLSPAMSIASWTLHPLTAMLNWIGNDLLARMGFPAAETNARLVSSAELAYIFEESSEGGLLEPSEQVYLENVIDFHERNVGQVMTPRNRMFALPVDADLTTVLENVCGERHSRYPVYADTRDEIVGILHVKDLARYLLKPAEPFNLANMVRPIMFVPESLPLDDMLGQFRGQHAQVAIVFDEYGGTAGIVTLEDLAEEIIGEIQDEYDEDIAPFAEIASNTLRVRGDLLLDELTQHYDLDFDTTEAETVGGLIMALLGQVPQPGDEVTQGELHFVVESTEGMAVATALVFLPGASPDSGMPLP